MKTTKPFSLTYVRYPKQSLLSHKLLALASLQPIFTACMTCSQLFTNREISDFAHTIGYILNELIAQSLKWKFKRERPKSCFEVDFCETHGMPSSHSQLAFYNCTYTVLLFLRRKKHVERIKNERNGIYKDSENMNLDKISVLLSISTVPIGFLVAISRVELGYHTVEQVVAGGVFGSLFGVVWYFVTCEFFLKRFNALTEENKFGNFLRDTLSIRDSSLCANPLGLSRERVELENAAFPLRFAAETNNKDD
jgi:dolichyldiphosphatase